MRTLDMQIFAIFTMIMAILLVYCRQSIDIDRLDTVLMPMNGAIFRSWLLLRALLQTSPHSLTMANFSMGKIRIREIIILEKHDNEKCNQ